MFNTNFFIFLFLPLVVLGVLVIPQKWRKLWLITASLVFYTLAEPVTLPLLLIFILLNYRLAGRIQQASTNPSEARRVLITGLVVNLGTLVLLKVGTVYLLPLALLRGPEGQNVGASASLQALADQFLGRGVSSLAMPLGISYLVFQTTAYLIDIYKQRVKEEKNGWNFLVYLIMFPKIIAGPIVRYQEISQQLSQQIVLLPNIARGLRRFVIGLGKKVLVADTLGITVDHIFKIPQVNLTTEFAWIGVLAYAGQLYFDFSGYSDMAIGLGQVFGFQLPENFNYPYTSRSLTEFWRRWHMTLLNWFRIYIFFPLERNRKGAGTPFQVLNILIVFLLTGLWHGVTLNYIVWGLLQGAILAIERTRFGVWLNSKANRAFQHTYTLLLILIGWTVFRSGDLGYAASFIKALFGFAPLSTALPFSIMPAIPHQFWLAFGWSILFSMPILPRLQTFFQDAIDTPGKHAVMNFTRDACLLAIFAATAIIVFTTVHQANIYGGF